MSLPSARKRGHHGDAVEFRHLDVEDQRVMALVGQQPQRFLAIGRDPDVEPRMPQSASHRGPHVRVVVDHQHHVTRAFTRGLVSPSCSSPQPARGTRRRERRRCRRRRVAAAVLQVDQRLADRRQLVLGLRVRVHVVLHLARTVSRGSTLQAGEEGIDVRMREQVHRGARGDAGSNLREVAGGAVRRRRRRAPTGSRRTASHWQPRRFRSHRQLRDGQ